MAEIWDEHAGIMVSSYGNVGVPTQVYRGRNVVRKMITVDGKVVEKRYLVARLVLECFPPDEIDQCNGLGNHNGKGTVVWLDGNELNDRADNLIWKWDGPGWTKEQKKYHNELISRSIEKLGLEEKYPELHKLSSLGV